MDASVLLLLTPASPICVYNTVQITFTRPGSASQSRNQQILQKDPTSFPHNEELTNVLPSVALDLFSNSS